MVSILINFISQGCFEIQYNPDMKYFKALADTARYSLGKL